MPYRDPFSSALGFWVRHLPSLPCRWIVILYGVEGWIDPSTARAVVDDFGSLVRV